MAAASFKRTGGSAMSTKKLLWLASVIGLAFVAWQAIDPMTVVIGDEVLDGMPRFLAGSLGLVIALVALLLTGVLLAGIFLGLGVVCIGMLLLLSAIPVAVAMPLLTPLLLIAGLIWLVRRKGKSEPAAPPAANHSAAR